MPEAIQSLLVGLLFLVGGIIGLLQEGKPGERWIGYAIAGLGAALVLAGLAELWVRRRPAAPAWREDGEECRRFRLRPVYAPGAFLLGLLALSVALPLWSLLRGLLPRPLWALGGSLFFLLPIHMGLRAVFGSVTLKGDTIRWRSFWGLPRELRLSRLTSLEVKATRSKGSTFRTIYLHSPDGDARFSLDWFRYPDELLGAIVTIAKLQESATRRRWLSTITTWLPAE